MSPARARTSRDAITLAARAILEEDGLDGVTMQAVADRVGVRAPSLYKHVHDRDALIRSIIDMIITELSETLRPRRSSADPGQELRAIARRYRTFVQGNPTGYALLFAPPEPGLRPDDATIGAIGAPIVTTVERLVGEDGALEAARTFVAWAHGFTSLEQAGGFQLGGDLDHAYAAGIDLILAGISDQVGEKTSRSVSGRASPGAG
jgi:AcrR family transcriptional regulator